MAKGLLAFALVLGGTILICGCGSGEQSAPEGKNASQQIDISAKPSGPPPGASASGGGAAPAPGGSASATPQ